MPGTGAWHRLGCGVFFFNLRYDTRHISHPHGTYMQQTYTVDEATKLCELGLAVIDTELEAIQRLRKQINNNFAQACLHLLHCTGRIVVTGMGKSGHIGNKIAATLASTGTPAFFMHPGEASHGDLGMITKNDVVLAISYSGETAEIITILPIIKRFNIPLITITGNPSSTIARIATINLDASIQKEACPLNLAPTASTTAALVMGDALAIALLEARGFTKEDFALAHPGGALGRKLLLRVEDIMHTGKDIPVVKEHALISEALLEMSSKRLGMTAVINEQNKLVGIYTDGDLRRTMDKEIDIKNTSINEVMTKNCTTIPVGTLAAELLQIMELKNINGIFVVDDNQQIIGALNLLDLVRSGVL